MAIMHGSSTIGQPKKRVSGGGQHVQDEACRLPSIKPGKHAKTRRTRAFMHTPSRPWKYTHRVIRPTASRPKLPNVLSRELGGGCCAPSATTGRSGYSGHWLASPLDAAADACIAAVGAGSPGIPGGSPIVFAITLSISTWPSAFKR